MKAINYAMQARLKNVGALVCVKASVAAYDRYLLLVICLKQEILKETSAVHKDKCAVLLFNSNRILGCISI